MKKGTKTTGTEPFSLLLLLLIIHKSHHSIFLILLIEIVDDTTSHTTVFSPCEPHSPLPPHTHFPALQLVRIRSFVRSFLHIIILFARPPPPPHIQQSIRLVSCPLCRTTTTTTTSDGRGKLPPGTLMTSHTEYDAHNHNHNHNSNNSNNSNNVTSHNEWDHRRIGGGGRATRRASPN